MDAPMIRTLIVEDELLARAGLHSLVEWEKLGFVLLEDAKDGQEALDRIHQYHPDLLLLDINIPIISGLELLKIIKDEKLEIKTVVISCYDDFDTVKMAMKLGALDYVRKFGLSKEELTNTLSNIVDNPQIRLTLNERKSAAQERRELKKEVQQVPEGFESGTCICLCMLWKHTDEMADLKIVETICSQFYHGLGKEIDIKIFEGKILLLRKEKGVKRSEIETLLKQIRHFITSECYAGITSYDISDMSDHFFLKMVNTIEIIGFYGASDWIVEIGQPVEIQTSYPFDVNQYYEQIDKALSVISSAQIMDILEQIFDQISSSKYLSVNLVKKLMIELLSRFSERASQLGGAVEELVVFGSYKHYQQIVHITNFDDMKEWFFLFAEEFVKKFAARQKSTDSDLIKQVLQYIDDNLTSVIQLNEAARYIGVSEPYLSTYFKKTMGENFIPYVNRKKIEAAEQMLSEGMLVYQVSDILGFENSTYFSKLFKKIKGITPEQYRKVNNKD